MVEMAQEAELADRDIADLIASVVLRAPHAATKVDASICLLQYGYLDSNVVGSVVQLLPLINEWLRTGRVHEQHLALELIANLATRFDLSQSVIDSNTLPCLFDLCIAIDESSKNSTG